MIMLRLEYIQIRKYESKVHPNRIKNEPPENRVNFATFSSKKYECLNEDNLVFEPQDIH